MTHDYKETLYINLFNVLSELTEHESPEAIFDRIVEDFATSAEYHMGQADTFKSMLDTFRHDNPVNTVSDGADSLVLSDNDFTLEEAESMLSGVNPFDREQLLEDRDQLLKFMSSVSFPDTSEL
tara:strand:+ start:663 stop:1034 length:372 start_codon:yes stop_codon:yes gene_type:complete